MPLHPYLLLITESPPTKGYSAAVPRTLTFLTNRSGVTRLHITAGFNILRITCMIIRAACMIIRITCMIIYTALMHIIAACMYMRSA